MVKFVDNSLPDLDEGEYPAVLTGVVWTGYQKQSERDAAKWGVKPDTPQMKFIFEVPTQMNRFNETVTMTKTIKNVTTSSRGGFIEVASAIVGKNLQSTELAMILKQPQPFADKLGKQVALDIAHFNVEGEERAYIKEVKKPHPKDDPVQGTRSTVYFDPAEPDMSAWSLLSYHIKHNIMTGVDSAEYPAVLQKQWVKDEEEQKKKEAEKANKEAAYKAGVLN